MKKPLALCSAALVALSLAVVPALGAAADDTPPPADIVEPIAEAAVAAPEPEETKLPICHSGSGTSWTFIAPDASGWNGHQHHDADIVGLSEAECLAKNVVVVDPPADPPADTTPFVLIAWPMSSWIDETTPTWPQGTHAGLAAPFVVDLATRNLNALDATLAALTVPCETSVQYQVDGNFDTEPVRATYTGGYLDGPGNPAEALWGGGWGEAYKLVKIDGPACPPPPTTVDCEVTSSTHSTNLAPAGWTGDGEWVEGGYKLSVDGDWESSWIERAVNQPIEQALADLDIDATPIQYVGLHFETADGRWVTYEEEPSYGGKLWSTSAFDGVPSGLGYAAFGTADEFVAENAGLNIVSVRFLYTHPEASSTVITSASYGCGAYTFDHEEPVIEPHVVNPLVPTFEDFCAVDADAVNVPEDTTDYYFEIDDQRVAGVGVVTVEAFATEGNTFPEGAVTTWSHEFTNEACPTTTEEPTPTPVVVVSTPGSLAETGVDGVTGLIAITVFLLAVGGLFGGIAVYRRRSDRTVD